MVTCDLACVALVLIMAVPGVPLAALIVLLFAVSLAIEPFLAARMATNRTVLGEKFQLGLGVTLATYQVAQLIGLAAGGAVVAVVGVRDALLIDAASFAASAVLIRFGVRSRPAADTTAGRPDILGGIRLVFGHPAARTAMLLIWLVTFIAVPEGVAVPLARNLGGGAVLVGGLLAAMAAGSAVGPLAWTRLVSAPLRTRLTAVAAGASVAVLAEFAMPDLRAAGALAILAVSGLFTGYIATASDALFDVIPDEHRGKAGGVVGAGMSGGQAIGILAGVALAQLLSPAVVIALAGVAGTACAVPLAVAWRRTRPVTEGKLACSPEA
jgi:predicted MFS family arabinose efflux permease